jgi:hypothetical protein
VYWVVDTAAATAQGCRTRLRPAHRNAGVVHLPVHASWLNQIEIYFSLVQRKVLTPNEFTGLEEVAARLAAFERRYEESANLFEWGSRVPTSTSFLKRLAGKPDLAPAAQPQYVTTIRARPLSQAGSRLAPSPKVCLIPCTTNYERRARRPRSVTICFTRSRFPKGAISAAPAYASGSGSVSSWLTFVHVDSDFPSTRY